MKTINLSNNKGITLVDDEDFDLLNRYSWYNNGHDYACRRGEDGQHLPIHYQLLGVKMVDHIDRNKLNNQRFNLRATDYGTNRQNSKISSNNKSGYRGVHYRPDRDLWCAQIKVNGVRFRLGSSHNVIEAAKLYDEAAIKHFGPLAATNF